jgi:outer membrane protein assembly factor BamB
MISERDKRLLLGLMGGILIVVMGLFVIGPILDMHVSWPPPEQVRFIKQQDEQFELLWESSPIYSGTRTSYGEVYFTSIGQNLFTIASFDDRPTSLYKLDIPTGTVYWHVLQKRSFPPRRPINLASNSQYIFVGLDAINRVDHENTRGASRVVAFDPANGQEVWSQPIGGALSVDSLIVTESIVSVIGFSYYYVLDAESGVMLEKISRAEEEPRGFVLFMDENISYEFKFRSIQAVDRRTGRKLWVQQAHCCIYEPPVITDKLLIVHTNPATGRVQAFDRLTGELVWQYDTNDVVSNLAMGDNSIVYFVTEEAHLLAVDAHTGQELGRVEFGPGRAGDQSTVYAYDVTASQDFVLVYMGDGQKLFAFRFLGGDE